MDTFKNQNRKNLKLAHYTQPPEPFKSKEEQLKDFEILSEMSDPKCGLCHGRAYQGVDINTQMYVPCVCLLKNLEKEMGRQNVAEDKREGILQGIRNFFGMN